MTFKRRGVKWPFLYAFLIVSSAWTLSHAATCGPLLAHSDPDIQREFVNAYQSACAPQISTGTAQNFYVNNGSATVFNIATSTITTLTASSGTVNSFMVVGTATNDNSPTGRLGQYIESLTASANVPTSNNWGDAGSVSLTAGDWNVSFTTEVDRNTATEAQLTNVQIGISQTTGNFSTGLVDGSNLTQTRFSAGITTIGMAIASYRQSVSATTIVYGKIRATYAGGQPLMYTRLSARRIR